MAHQQKRGLYLLEEGTKVRGVYQTFQPLCGCVCKEEGLRNQWADGWKRAELAQNQPYLVSLISDVHDPWGLRPEARAARRHIHMRPETRLHQYSKAGIQCDVMWFDFVRNFWIRAKFIIIIQPDLISFDPTHTICVFSRDSTYSTFKWIWQRYPKYPDTWSAEYEPWEPCQDALREETGV